MSIRNKLGLIHIYCGDGKGKTTACIGLGIRAAGNGLNVLMCQFLKSMHTGELNIINKIDNFKIIRSSEKFPFYKNMTEKQKYDITQIHNDILSKAISLCENNMCDLLILDEVINAYNFNLIDKNKLTYFLKQKNKNIEIALSGRNPKKELIEIADYITKMDKIKHPYDKNIMARYGIEL